MEDFLNQNKENKEYIEDTLAENSEITVEKQSANVEDFKESDMQNSSPQSDCTQEPITQTENTDSVIENEHNTISQSEFEHSGVYTPVYNKVNFSQVNQVNDYRPMSKGLKIFTLLMAVVIALTGACFAGYMFGKNGVSIGRNNKVHVNLAATPKDTDEMTAAEVYESVNESVVGITVYNTSGQGTYASGIVFSEDGYIITNDHCYAEVPAAKFKIYAYDGSEYDAEFVAGDKVSDLAVLKVSGVKFTPAKFGNSDELYYGQNVAAIGRPNDAADPSSITKGIISALDRRIQTTSQYSARLIQTDSAINPGSSGGALVNMYGQVVGVTSSKLASVEYDAVGFAIPTTVMKRVVEELISEGKVVSRAKLGVSYTVIDSVTAEIKGYASTGLLLAEVSEDSDLYGKVKAGDIIVEINNTKITRDEIVLNLIESCYAGDTITVTVITENGETKTCEAVLKQNLSESSYTLSQSDNLTGESSGNNGGTFDFPFGD